MSGEDNGTVRIIGAEAAETGAYAEYHEPAVRWVQRSSAEVIDELRVRLRGWVWLFVAVGVWISFFAAAWLLAFGQLSNPVWLWAWGGLCLAVTLFAPRGNK